MRSPERWTNSFVDPFERTAPLPTASAVARLGDLAGEILEQSGQAVCVTDAELDRPGPRISWVNPAYLDIFCCDIDDVIGRSPRFAQGPLTDRVVLDRIREHLVEGTPVRAQVINYRFDRTVFRLRWSIDPIRRAGRVTHFVGLLDDVTTQDRMRRRLTALDTILTAGRPASSLSGRERDRAVARALAESMAPMVAEIGGALVRVGDDEASVAPPSIGVTDDPIVTRLDIGSVGSLTVTTHPDAGALVDHLGMQEMAAQAAWLAGISPPPAT
ncbi:PAS domain-containing protein [Ilumatobacter sp.]|uniref:PAS domain-containing protein n=1 Tax=Ilumatobacter sp. TaxID=1967498 RepID=UPI003B52A568